MTTYLETFIANKQTKADELREQIQQSKDAGEVRALGETLNAVLQEIREAKEAQETENRKRASDSADALHPLAAYGTQKIESAEKRQADRFDSVEYRTAFMQYVCRNVPIPTEFRADAITTTTDASAVIPTTLMHEIIQKLDTYGNIYSKVRKMNVQGGVEFPILSLKPVASWITETTVSDTQKLQANTKITFSYFGLECRIAQTLLASVTTLDAFQNLFVKLATEAMVRKLEEGILKGTGSGQMLGITVDSRVPSANVLTLTPDDFASWSAWKKKVFAKMKKAYRNGTFFMAQGTFDGYIDGMTDTVGQPIGRVNYGIDGAENYRFGGKTVETVEDDVIADYETASAGDVVAVFANLTDYAINSNMQMTVVNWTDHDTNELKTKAILICDGKLIDPNGVLIIKKGAAATG